MHNAKSIKGWQQRCFVRFTSSSLFEPVLKVHYLAALDIGAGVEQSFDCLIIQNRQAMHCIGWSMDRTVKGNMFHGLILLRHTHRPQRKPYPIWLSRSENVRHRCGGG